MRPATLFALFPLVLTPSCMHGDMTGEDAVQSVGLSIDRLDDASRTHAASAARAPDVAAMGALESDHHRTIEREVGILDSAVRALGSCVDHIGRAPPTASFWSEIDAVRGEADVHDAARPTDLAGASAEETRHAAAMSRIVAELRISYGALDRDSSAYRCRQECTHCMD